MRRIINDLCSPYFIAYKALSHLARPRFPVSSGDWASFTTPGTVNLFPQHGSPGPKPPAHDPLPRTPGHWMPQRIAPNAWPENQGLGLREDIPAGRAAASCYSPAQQETCQ